MSTRPAVHTDPTGDLHGLPTWHWRSAPDGYATARQLRALGLRPGGQPVAGQLVRGRRLYARLYRIDLARPKREATLRQHVAILAAFTARHRCHGPCGRLLPYIPPKRTGYRCNDCADTGAL